MRRKNYQRRKFKNLEMDHTGFWQKHFYILNILNSENVANIEEGIVKERER